MHTDHKLAKAVLANQPEYPHIIIEYAEMIDTWFTDKRNAVAFVSKHGYIL